MGEDYKSALSGARAKEIGAPTPGGLARKAPLWAGPLEMLNSGPGLGFPDNSGAVIGQF